MKKTVFISVFVGALILSACDSGDAEITTTTLDAASLTTTTTTATTTETTESPGTTAPPADQIESSEVISRVSTEEGETLYILVPPGNYSDVSIENFLGDLLAEDEAVSGVEIFDNREALDAALKEEGERTDEENELIAQHHLVSLSDKVQVDFRGPMEDYSDFVIGS